MHISRAVKNFSTEPIHPVLRMANIHFNNLEKFFQLSLDSRHFYYFHNRETRWAIIFFI